MSGKRLYSIPQIYGIAVKAFRGAGTMARGRKSGVLDEKLQERIMLAVTAVNSCPMCSYAHTEMALKAGMSDAEIKNLMSGEFDDVPDDELRAVLFAQHYADAGSRITRDTFGEIVKAYGQEKADCILAATRAIMFGNSVGIVFSSLKSRFKGEGGDERSSIGYELAVILCLLPMLILSVLQALIMNLLHLPKI